MLSPITIKHKVFFLCLLLDLMSGFTGSFLLYFIPAIIVFLNTGINLLGSLTILIGALILSSLFFILAGFPGAVLSIIEVSVLSFFLVFMTKYDMGGVKTLLGGALILSVFFTASFVAFSDKDVSLQKNIDKTYQEIEDIYKKKQLDLTFEERMKFETFLKKLKIYISRFLPAFIALGIIATVFFNILFARFLSLKKNIEIFKPQFNKWQLPDYIVWFFIAGGIMAFILEEPYRLVGENAVFIVSFLYLIQGCSVINYLFNTMDFPYWVRFLFYFLMILQWYGIVFLAVVGMSDIWLDWRNKLTPKKEEISN